MAIVNKASNQCRRFDLKVVKCKISAKRDLRKLNQGTYSPTFRRIQLIFDVYSVLSNYFLECFGIEHT